jgi:hypothetical protein
MPRASGSRTRYSSHSQGLRNRKSVRLALCSLKIWKAKERRERVAFFILTSGCADSRARVETFRIGTSVEGIPLVVTMVGTGRDLAICILGAIHGDEGNTSVLVRTISDEYAANPELVPARLRLYFLPTVNPDGFARNQRRNKNNVDLNRNFPTPNWKKDAISPGVILAGSGGSSPGSEPETGGVISFLLQTVKPEVKEIWVVSYHAQFPPTGAVQPGYLTYGKPGKESDKLARAVAEYTGYRYIATWVSRIPITGELLNWCELAGMRVADIELPSHEPPDAAQKGGRPTAAELHSGLVRRLIQIGTEAE